MPLLLQCWHRLSVGRPLELAAEADLVVAAPLLLLPSLQRATWRLPALLLLRLDYRQAEPRHPLLAEAEETSVLERSTSTVSTGACPALFNALLQLEPEFPLALPRVGGLDGPIEEGEEDEEEEEDVDDDEDASGGKKRRHSRGL